MKLAKKGDRVRINFTGTLADGSIFDTTLEETDCSSDDCSADDCSCETGPMELTIGGEEFFSMIEDALVGMAPGEKKTVVIPAAEAFGEYDEEEVFTIRRDQLSADITPEVGQELELTDDDGEDVEVIVVELNDTEITLDANHPLAGEDITYEVELLEIL
jgi:peptidylprolyl isomerase